MHGIRDSTSVKKWVIKIPSLCFFWVCYAYTLFKNYIFGPKIILSKIGFEFLNPIEKMYLFLKWQKMKEFRIFIRKLVKFSFFLCTIFGENLDYFGMKIHIFDTFVNEILRRSSSFFYENLFLIKIHFLITF